MAKQLKPVNYNKMRDTYLMVKITELLTNGEITLSNLKNKLIKNMKLTNNDLNYNEIDSAKNYFERNFDSAIFYLNYNKSITKKNKFVKLTNKSKIDNVTKAKKIRQQYSQFLKKNEEIKKKEKEKEDTIENEIKRNQNIGKTEKENLVNSRIGQGKFREKIISYWKKCCVTGLQRTELLRASHIKPWCESTNEERLSKFNGLLLNPNMDVLFDKGIISFNDDGKIMLNRNKISINEAIKLGYNPKCRIKIEKKHKIFLNYHREYIYKK